MRVPGQFKRVINVSVFITALLYMIMGALCYTWYGCTSTLWSRMTPWLLPSNIRGTGMATHFSHKSRSTFRRLCKPHCLSSS